MNLKIILLEKPQDLETVDFFKKLSYDNYTKIGDSLPKTLKRETIKIGDSLPKALKRETIKIGDSLPKTLKWETINEGKRKLP